MRQRTVGVGKRAKKQAMGENTKGDDDAAAAPPPQAPPASMRRNDVSMTDMSDVDNGDNYYHVRKSRLIRLINWWQVRSGREVGRGGLERGRCKEAMSHLLRSCCCFSFRVLFYTSCASR